VDLGLAGRAAIVTASSKGLGRAAAEALAAEGASVLISSRGGAALDETAANLAASGADVVAVAADVTDPATPDELVRRALEHFGRLDIVVANAGGPPAGRALDVGDEALVTAFQANMVTSVRLVRAALPHLREAGWGRICCITSHSVVQPMPTLALSNVARVGLWAWAKTAALDLGGTGVTLNLVCPGSHATDRMRELGGSGPMGEPADFGAVVAFLCSARAAFVNGAAVVVNGGVTLDL
jgi:3-oxoacyl-[acyl-carrier protein] reductase